MRQSEQEIPGRNSRREIRGYLRSDYEARRQRDASDFRLLPAAEAFGALGFYQVTVDNGRAYSEPSSGIGERRRPGAVRL